MQYNEPILKAVKKISRGVILPIKKNTAESSSVLLPPPEKVVIPLLQHIGEPCLPLVEKGDTVYVGTKIGDSEELTTVPIHSSVSGTVDDIGSITLTSGEECQTVEILSDGLMAADPELKPVSINSKEELIAAARESGVVGLGGAGFPLHIKLGLTLEKQPDTLIINATESEPYITCDYRECIENAENILEGACLLKEYLGFREVIICVEDNMQNAIKAIYEAITNSGDFDAIKLMSLKTQYPIGAENVLTFAATGRELPMDKQPIDVGCLVMNVTTVSALNTFIKTGMPLVNKRVTVDGNAIREPKNVIVPIGTSTNDVLEFCGLKTYPKKVIYGGPMMGTAVNSTDMPIVKQNNAVLVFGRKAAARPLQHNCIRCGRCAAVCPMKLRPFEIANAQSKGKVEQLKKLYANHCIECGCCSYICPSKRDVTGAVCLAKAKLEEARED